MPSAKSICKYSIRSQAKATSPARHAACGSQVAKPHTAHSSAFVNPGWSLVAKGVETGQCVQLGFIPIDTPAANRKLQDVPLADGVWEIEVRLHQWYWPNCRWRKITTLVTGDQAVEKESLSAIHNLRHSIEHFRSVLR